MNPLLKEIRHKPLLWLLAFLPVVFAAQKLKPEAHTLPFVLSVLAIVPLAVLLSHATESVVANIKDAIDIRRRPGCVAPSRNLLVSHDKTPAPSPMLEQGAGRCMDQGGHPL